MSEQQASYKTFESLARNYCETLKAAVETSPFHLVAIEAALLDLYVAATRLPPVALVKRYANQAKSPGAPEVSHAEWTILNHQLRERLPFDTYWDTFDPLSTTERDSICSGLADDLADIWRDMTEGLRQLEAQQSPNEVWWEWRFSSYSHWGAHAAGAIRAIHHFHRSEE